MPPSPALMNTLVDTLVHIFAALALATKYCDSAVRSDSRLKKGARALFRRTSEFSQHPIAVLPLILSPKRITSAYLSTRRVFKYYSMSLTRSRIRSGW